LYLFRHAYNDISAADYFMNGYVLTSAYRLLDEVVLLLVSSLTV